PPRRTRSSSGNSAWAVKCARSGGSSGAWSRRPGWVSGACSRPPGRPGRSRGSRSWVSTTSTSWWRPLQPDVGVVIVAAGQGTRLGGAVPKQYLPLGGVPLLLRALRPFTAHPEVGHTVVVLPAAEAATPPA